MLSETHHDFMKENDHFYVTKINTNTVRNFIRFTYEEVHGPHSSPRLDSRTVELQEIKCHLQISNKDLF